MKLWMIFAVMPLVLCNSSENNELCPGGLFSCPDTSTCCKAIDGSYSCCALENAVCCDDSIYCCPKNTRCANGTCERLHKFNATYQAVAVKPHENEINCSAEYVCSDDSTCCEGQENGTYACCPMKQAVCCKDRQHCCPQGTKCDLRSQMCVGTDYNSLMYDFIKTPRNQSLFKKIVVPEESKNASNIVCPGSESQCPDGYTCCQLPDSRWGCCPFPNANCCPDKEHCCPQGSQCNAASQSCSKKGQSMKSAPTVAAKPNSVSIDCPDESICSDISTCCQLKSKHYGCCPYLDAICCSDGVHCCPNGYVCSLESQSCVPRNNSSLLEDFRVNMI